jgi:HEPN domain-containing protein
MNWTDFQNLANERLSDAELLLASGRFDCAYYVAGYAVECALKACIARKTKEGDFPPRDSRKFWTHDLEDLLDSAGLVTERAAVAQQDQLFHDNWVIVKDWSESSRYEINNNRPLAENMLEAISNSQNGLLPWLKTYW